MPILSHGSDLSLAPTLRPVVREAGGTVRGALDRLVAGGFRSVQLDAALPGVRPRDLDARARKDLAALLVRHGLAAGGIDLFIPRRHYFEPAHADRAMTATLAAIGLAADLGKLTLSLGLPVKRLTDDARRSLVEEADRHGVRLAVHAEGQSGALLEWVEAVDLPALGVALDPAAVLARAGDPAAEAGRLSKRLLSARLDDVAGASAGDDDEAGGEASGLRVAVGEGDLDLEAYRLALDLAPARTGPVVLDLRGLEGPLAGAERARRAWDAAAFTA